MKKSNLNKRRIFSKNNYSSKSSSRSSRKTNFKDNSSRKNFNNNNKRTSTYNSKRSFSDNSSRNWRQYRNDRPKRSFDDKDNKPKRNFRDRDNKNDNSYKKNGPKISNRKSTKEDRKKYFKKTDDNYLSKRFKRDSKHDLSHKPKSPLIRLNKFLYEKNICSRREADKFIKQGLIFINGKKAIIGQKIHPIKDKIKINDSVKKELKNKIVVALNKPKGFVSENPTENEREASSLLPFTEKLSALGRLDKNSTGLLLLTNDGKIVNQLLNPDFDHEKEYIVDIDRKISPLFLKRMKEGIDIGGYVTKKAKIRKISDTTFRLTLTEGKNHQIKKMVNALGYTVRNLKRTRFNTVKLNDLAIGKYRIIEGKEYLKLVGKF